MSVHGGKFGSARGRSSGGRPTGPRSRHRDRPPGARNRRGRTIPDGGGPRGARPRCGWERNRACDPGRTRRAADGASARPAAPPRLSAGSYALMAYGNPTMSSSEPSGSSSARRARSSGELRARRRLPDPLVHVAVSQTRSNPSSAIGSIVASPDLAQTDSPAVACREPGRPGPRVDLEHSRMAGRGDPQRCLHSSGPHGAARACASAARSLAEPRIPEGGDSPTGPIQRPRQGPI